MNTVVIRIEELSKRLKGYPVQLYVDDGSPDWLQKDRQVESSLIAEDLSIESPPDDPVSEKPLQGSQLRDLFLEEEESSRRFESIGEYLYKLLFQEKLKEKWIELCQPYPKQGEQTEGRRTILDIKPATLRMLPWELMHNDHLYLFLDNFNPIMRGDLKTVAHPSCYQWPLHVLIVVGSTDDDEEVKAEEEILDLQAALVNFGRPVEFEILKRPTNQVLVDMFKTFQPHIFHFIGHGKNQSGGTEPVLAFEAEGNNRPWEWSAGKIIRDLRLSWMPRLAFLNACRSSDAKVSEKVWGVTEAFIKAGVPAVLGMQANIQGDAAANFPGRFYAGLSSDVSLDVALVEARAYVSRMEDDSLERRDWALATLFLSLPPEQILPMQPRVTSEFKRALDTQFSIISDFVDRVKPRRTLWHGVEPMPNSSEPKNLLIVRGTPEAGKTWLVYWCLKSCAWRERNIAYVSLKQHQNTKDFLQVLRLIKAGDGNHPIGRPLAPEAFYGFNETVNYLLDPAKKEPPLGSAGIGTRVEDKGFPLRDDIDHEAIKAIIGAFKVALQIAAKNQPLIIALDDLVVRKDHFKEYLLRELINPIAVGQEETLKNIRIILVVSDNEYNDLGLETLENVAVTVRLEHLAKSEVDLFSRELCILKGMTREQTNSFTQFFNTARATTVKPDDVRQFLKIWDRLNR